jgi:hypothetical protein
MVHRFQSCSSAHKVGKHRGFRGVRRSHNHYYVNPLCPQVRRLAQNILMLGF